MDWEIETVKEIWHNKDGTCFEVGPDRDGLGLIEIRLRESGKITMRLSFPKEAAKLIAVALGELLS